MSLLEWILFFYILYKSLKFCKLFKYDTLRPEFYCFIQYCLKTFKHSQNE